MSEKKDAGIIIENNTPEGFIAPPRALTLEEQTLDVLKEILAALEKKP